MQHLVSWQELLQSWFTVPWPRWTCDLRCTCDRWRYLTPMHVHVCFLRTVHARACEALSRGFVKMADWIGSSPSMPGQLSKFLASAQANPRGAAVVVAVSSGLVAYFMWRNSKRAAAQRQRSHALLSIAISCFGHRIHRSSGICLLWYINPSLDTPVSCFIVCMCACTTGCR